MRILLQRVNDARVRVDGEVVGEISTGLLSFVGFTSTDDEAVMDHLVKKMIQLRIFEDEAGKMNLSVQDLGFQVLIVSQFTLYGDTRKGNRPSFIAASEPAMAERLYDRFVQKVQAALGEGRVATGIFRASMQVELVNSGPVTIMLEA
ncbi:MAG TPA: D-aminoacyl-tRNA deacylase [Candidatus Kapabacteria bacterium]|nr:D-aminoacyl-tRNA deacylase [Candidatus Kapabacteria bacterium]